MLHRVDDEVRPERQIDRCQRQFSHFLNEEISNLAPLVIIADQAVKNYVSHLMSIQFLRQKAIFYSFNMSLQL